jgi:hypothetical protein
LNAGEEVDGDDSDAMVSYAVYVVGAALCVTASAEGFEVHGSPGCPRFAQRGTASRSSRSQSHKHSLMEHSARTSDAVNVRGWVSRPRHVSRYGAGARLVETFSATSWTVLLSRSQVEDSRLL